MSRNITILLVFAGLICFVLFFRHLDGKNGHAVSNSNPAASMVSGQYRGISLQIHSGDPERPYEELIKEIARTGANCICLVVHAFQETTKASAVYIDQRETPDRKKLHSMIKCAHDSGMKVMIMPVIRLTYTEGSWRGKINPENWERWWASYTDCVVHFARIAEDSRVELLSVGSELISTVKQEKQWRRLIKTVRKYYSGRLLYSANWDWYKVAKWWDALDIVGMTSYYTLAKGTGPELDEMMRAWKGIKKEILDWQKTVKRPIIFTEVGWPNQETAAEYPWNYYKAPDKPDPRQQALCFESFFRTWVDTPGVAGYFIWEWRDKLDEDNDPRRDTSYCPRGKPAMKLIREYFERSGPEPASAPAQKN